jgi:hypothetical protein
MFLDDQIVEIMTTSKDVNAVSKLLIDKFNQEVNTSITTKDYLASARKVCNLYDSAVTKLKKMGNFDLVEGGFRKALLESTAGDALTKIGF